MPAIYWQLEIASARSHCSDARDRQNLLLYGGVNVVDAQDLAHRAGFDCFCRHAKNYRSGFILRQHHSARRLNCGGAGRPVVPHAGQNYADAQWSSKGGDAFHGDINVWEIAVDAACAAIELNTARGHDAQMLTTGANVKCSGS